ncbi:MAG: RNA polymerase Rpb6 [Cytophagaceae bacterium]|nr:MAG: RNA polymerase Rpb6 [Cytophagaceae bacterium]
MSNTKNTPTGPASSTITRDVRQLNPGTGNLYESLVVIARRSNQISANLKEELHNKLSEFASSNDNLEEVFENREQIEISKFYERMPKPTTLATDEFLAGKVYFRYPEEGEEK